MEGTGGMNVVPGGQDQAQNQQPKVVERLNPAVQQQLNLESVKTRAIGLYKAISRILEDFENIRRTGSEPKWQDLMGQYSMVNLELFNIMEDIKKVSKAFVVHPKNVNAENATVLPVMLSSKLLPEMETEDNSKREQLLHGTENLPVLTQIEKLKERISMIDAACGSAEKVLADCRKAYGLGSRQAPAVTPTLDKVQAAKIQEQETILRAAVNSGQGLHIPPDQRQVPASLPMHLADVLSVDSAQGFPDASGLYKTTTPSMTSNVSNTQGSVPQATGSQHIGRSVPSPSGPIGTTSFDNITTSPLPYANSPRSSTNIMNIPSPQQHQQQQHQQQQRQKMMQLPHQQQQILAQQQYRQSSTPGLGQSQLSQLHDMAQQKFQSVPGQHQMQYSQSLAHQQFQNRQLLHGMGQNQLGQGNSLRSHLSQFSGATNNSALFNNAQTTPNTQMITNMSATMPSQSLLPRMQQFGLSSGQSQRSHPSQILSDQMFSMGGTNQGTNQGNMMPMQQQQQQTLGGGFGNMGAGNPQNLQSSNVLGMQNASSQLPNYQQQQQQQQRQQNQQQ